MPRPLDILLVEDNPDHAELAQAFLEESGVEHHLHHLLDGAEALPYLRRQGPFAHAREPDLVLLDLFLPGLSGKEIAEEIFKDVNLRHLRVVLLTSGEFTDEEKHQLQSKQHCTCLSKPLKLPELIPLLEEVRANSAPE